MVRKKQRATETVAPIEWPVTDWKDASLYPDPQDLSHGIIAWEFVRRSSTYRKAWCSWLALKKKHGIDLHADAITITPETSTDLFDLDPVARPGETFGDYEERLGEGIRFTYLWKASRIAEELEVPFFETLDPHHPHWARTRSGIQLDGSLQLSFGKGLPRSSIAGLSLSRPPKKHEVDVRFDLREHLDDQLAGARILLKHKQETSRIVPAARSKLQANLLPMYLRLLDAREASATYQEIAAHFHPKDLGDAVVMKSHRDRYQKDFNTAVKIRDGGWRDLARISSRGKR